MRVILSLVITVAIGMGVYAMYLKSTVSSTGGHPVSAISTTSVKMQLLQIAQAERTYYVQNNSYATIDQLASSRLADDEDSGPRRLQLLRGR